MQYPLAFSTRISQFGESGSGGFSPRACVKAMPVSPAHQFPLGMSLPVERRLSLLSWGYEVNAFVVEDDYDIS